MATSNEDDPVNNIKTNNDDAEEEEEEGDDGIYINIAVPPGAEPGVDLLTFEYEGTSFEILIPEGAVPGDVLRIQVGIGAGADGGNGEGEGDDDADDDAREKKKGGLLGALGGMIDDDDDDDDDDHEGESGTSNANKNSRSNNMTTPAAITLDDGITAVPLGDGLDWKLYCQTDNNGDGTDTVTDNKTSNDSQANSPPATLNLFDALPDANTTTAKEGDGTHAMVWPSGIVLAQVLTSTAGVQFLTRNLLEQIPTNGGDKSCKQSDQTNDVNCLELGAGLGVCGLATAHALASSSGASGKNINIILTDQGQEAKKLLDANILRNQPPDQKSSNNSPTISITAQSFTWGESFPINNNNNQDDTKFHLILGSDLLYNSQESYDPLLQTIQQHLHKHGIIVLACRWRKPIFERKFFKKAQDLGMEFELCKDFLEDEYYKKRCPCLLDWRDYGNPAREASNKFFHETIVSVTATGHDNAKTSFVKSLAEVSETDMEQMTFEEYTTFEELQVQIYVGKFVDSKSKKRPRDNC